MAFARYLPVEVPRIALVDFNNDTVGDSLATAAAFWQHYRAALEAGDAEGQRRWTLDGVRLDTSASVRDVSLSADDPFGVNPKLVRLVRAALDEAWQVVGRAGGAGRGGASLLPEHQNRRHGRLQRRRASPQYEREHVPVDVYGVGSSLLRNDRATNTDFTMDVVRVQIDGALARRGESRARSPTTTPICKPVDLSAL